LAFRGNGKTRKVDHLQCLITTPSNTGNKKMIHFIKNVTYWTF